MAADSDVKKFDTLKKDFDTLKSRKDKLEGQLKASADALLKIEQELKAEGISSKEQLDEEILKLEKELAMMMSVTEEDILKAKEQLDNIELSLG